MALFFREKTKMIGAEQALPGRPEPLPLVPDSYWVELVMSDGYQFIEKVERVDRLDVVFANSLGTGKIPSRGQGYFVLPCQWKHEG